MNEPSNIMSHIILRFLYNDKKNTNKEVEKKKKKLIFKILI